MKWMLIIALILSSTTQYPMQVIAQTQKPAPQKNTNRPKFIPPKLPPGAGTVSGRRTGMGSRDNCPAVTTELTALVPSVKAPTSKEANTSVSEIVGGLTTSSRPTFWFYMPYTNNLSGANAQFSLQDSAGNEVYKNTIALPSQPGVIDITLPSNVASLEIDKTYRWFLKVRCTQQQAASVPIYVEGDIQRVNLTPTIAQQLETATPQQKVTIYATNGIWFDSINILAQLRSSNEADWQLLLQSVGLGNIATAPFTK